MATAACGTASNPEGGNDAGNGAVSSSPLSGVVDGMPFSPMSAIGLSDFGSDGGTRFVTVYELAADCSNPYPIVPRAANPRC
jgi:hypothetical protein